MGPLPSKLEDCKLDQLLLFQVSALSKEMKAKLEGDLIQLGVTRFEWSVLFSIAIEKYTSPSDLAEHIGVSRPAISRLLRSMESSNLIERNHIGSDGRTRHLKVTDIGILKMEQCWPSVHDNQKFYEDKLSESQAQNLSSAIHSLVDKPAAADKPATQKQKTKADAANATTTDAVTEE